MPRIGVLLFSLFIALIAVRLSSVGFHSPISAVSYRFSDEGLPSMNDNTRLLHSAEKLFTGQIIAPEHFAFSADGFIYFSVHDGRIMRTKPSADGTSLGALETIVYTGNPTLVDRQHPCGSEESESICGRPLGMTFNTAGKLIVADCYFGLLEVDVINKTKRVLLDSVDGQSFYFTNSVVIGPKSGKMYLTDSSSRWRRRDFIYESLENEATGRVIEYNPHTDTARVLVDRIAFANGILVDDDETYLLVNELNRSQIIRIDLTLVSKLSVPIHWNDRRESDDEYIHVVIDNLPGLPDNLSWEGKGSKDSKGIIWTGCGTTRKQPFNIVHALSTLPAVRNFLSWLLPKKVFLSLVPQVGVLLRIQLQQGKSLLNPKGYFMGTLIETLQDSTGVYKLLTGAYLYQDYLYVGSISDKTDYVTRLPWTQKNITDVNMRFKD